MANLLPFRMGTRQRRAKVGVIPFSASASGTPLELPRVGMASRLILQLRGTSTKTTGAAADLGPWNLLSRIRVVSNIGSAVLVDVTGYGAYVAQRFLRRAWSPENAGSGSTTVNADQYAFPDTSGAVVLTYEIPLGANDGANFESGLINLQAPETRVTVEPVFGAATDAAASMTAFTGNLHVYYEYYEIPDPSKFALPPQVLVRIMEEQQAIGQTGDIIYTVPRMGTVLNLAHVVILNGARSDSVDSFAVKFNKTDQIYSDERQLVRVMERELYGLPPNTGVFYNDLFHAYGDVNKGDTRDAIDSEQLTTFESIVTVSSGATLGSNNNFLRSIRRIVQVLA